MQDYIEHYTEGSYAPYVTELRSVSSASGGMLEISQPAGEFPDPPTPELVIIQGLCKSTASIDLGAGRFVAGPATGALVVSAPMSGMDVTVSTPHRIRVLAVPPIMLQRWAADAGRNLSSVDLGSVHARDLNSPIILHLLERLWEEATESVHSSRLLEDAALMTIWAELLREGQMPLRIAAKGGLAPWQVRRCIEYLNDRSSDNVGLEDLAALVGLSPFHFSRAFKHSTGLPPHRFQLNLRIARAKALLEASDLPVTQIAFDVGYESSQALARLFRREVGYSPSEYRRRHRA